VNSKKPKKHREAKTAKQQKRKFMRRKRMMNSRFTDLPPDRRVSIHVVADKVNRNRHPMRPQNLTVKEKIIVA